MLARFSASILVLFLNGCAVLHHVSVGDIDNRGNWSRKKIDLMVSETGINLDQAAQIAGQFGGKKLRRQSGEFRDALTFLQFGPRTGNPVFTEDYARNLNEQLRALCPSGKVTAVNSIRENRSYPVISGEIVKITAYCLSNSRRN